jgi:hypothetical protein
MKNSIKMAFDPEAVEIAVENILPLKKIRPAVKHTIKYRQISTSIKEVGVIEHLVVYAEKQMQGKYILLDGHLRLEVLKEMGVKKVYCLISKDDEAFTYNHKISRLATIQEHFMILKAIERGVSEDRIAAVLDVDVARIRIKRDLLNGIAPEATELLKDKHVSPNAIRILRKLKPARQIEVCEIMMAAHNYTVPFAKALFMATPESQLLEDNRKKNVDAFSSEEMARMEKETEVLARDIKLVKEAYGKDTLNLVVSCGFLTRMLDNNNVIRYLSKNYPEILSGFQKIIEASSLSQ